MDRQEEGNRSPKTLTMRVLTVERLDHNLKIEYSQVGAAAGEQRHEKEYAGRSARVRLHRMCGTR